MPRIIKEDDFIIETLENFIADLQTEKPREQIIDKHSCVLTAYMQGQMKQIIAFERRLDAAIKRANKIANSK
jgi:hypothetical protein